MDAKAIFSECSPSVFKLQIRTVDGDVILGSGFVASLEDRTVLLTNKHIVENAAEVKIDGNESKIDVVAAVKVDPKLDLAVITLEETAGLKALQIRMSQLEIGETVYVIGYPHGLNKAITQGMLSTEEDPVAVFSAPISSGNSGCPLIDRFGRVIGVVTASANQAKGEISQNFNFAIKASEIPSLELFTPLKSHLFAAFKIAANAEKELYSLLKEPTINKKCVSSLDFIVLLMNINNIEFSKEDLKIKDQFEKFRKATEDPVVRERTTVLSSDIFKHDFAPIIANDEKKLQRAVDVLESMKHKIGELNQKSKLLAAVATDSRRKKLFDNSYDIGLAPQFLEHSINRLHHDLKCKRLCYQIILEIMSRAQDQQLKYATHILRRESRNSHLDESPESILKSLEDGHENESGNPLLSPSSAKPAPERIDFSLFRDLSVPLLDKSLSEYSTDQLLQSLKNIELPYPPLDMDYRKLGVMDRGHAAYGRFLSTLVDIYDVTSIEMMEQGRLDDAERAIEINDSNRPHHKYYFRKAELQSMRGNHGISASLYEQVFNELQDRFDPFAMKFGTRSDKMRVCLALSGRFSDSFSKYPPDLANRMKGWDKHLASMVQTKTTTFEDVFAEKEFKEYSDFEKLILCRRYSDITDRMYFDTLQSQIDKTKDPLQDFPSLKLFLLTLLQNMDPAENSLREPSSRMVEMMKLIYPQP